jgi:hypothetical protein
MRLEEGAILGDRCQRIGGGLGGDGTLADQHHVDVALSVPEVATDGAAVHEHCLDVLTETANGRKNCRLELFACRRGHARKLSRGCVNRRPIVGSRKHVVSTKKNAVEVLQQFQSSAREGT